MYVYINIYKKLTQIVYIYHIYMVDLSYDLTALCAYFTDPQGCDSTFTVFSCYSNCLPHRAVSYTRQKDLFKLLTELIPRMVLTHSTHVLLDIH